MSFCRITGRSRGLPKPNYFPLLAPISPADAKRCCRITGKSYGLPTHHYIPVLLTSNSSKAKCKITNVSGELGPHHYAPEIHYGNRKHDLLPDYRYIFPVLDGSTEAQKVFMDMLLTKQTSDDKRYVYTVQERRCSLVFSAQMEMAVRDGDVRDVMLAKDSDTVLIRMKQGRNVSMDFKDFTEDVELFEGEGPSAEVLKLREVEELEEKKRKRKRAAALSSVKKIFENKEQLADVEELAEEQVRLDRKSKKAKFDEHKHEKHDLKTFNATNFDVHHMKSKSSIAACNGEWKDQMHPIIECWDWENFEKEIGEEHVVPKVTKLPTPVKIAPFQCNAEIYEVDKNISDMSVSLDNVPCVNPLKPVKSRPSETILNAVKELSNERLTETADVTEKLCLEDKIGMLPTLENLPEVVKNIHKGKRSKVAKISGLTLDINKAKKFIPGQHINTPQGPMFVAGQTVDTPAGPVFVPGLSVNTPHGPGLIPGHIVNNENTNEPFFLAGQLIKTTDGKEFVCGQTIKTKDESHRFVEGQTVISEEGIKFIPGKIINNGPEEVFVPGQAMNTPEGVRFVPGQTITDNNGIIFTPGQNAKINNEWQFVPGQVVHQENEAQFVPGATIATPNGLKFVPGQTVSIDGETCFVPGISRSVSNNKLEFVPGTTVDTVDGPKFLEGQIVHTDFGEKFVPGKTIVNTNGSVEFSVAKSVADITFSDSAPVGLPIDIRSCSVSEEALYVYGHMVQTAKGIEFYPGPRVPKIEGKVVPGRLVKNEENKSRFVPGMMVEGIFVPGQIVFTENGEQFVPGQVVDTTDGPKFVPGQVVNTKSGPKFVPGQTIHTIDGPRFVPGQIIETKAGPTFIPGQIIHTEAEGSRFVPGQVVDTEEGPRFVPGRVIETDDNGVTFIPGQVVQTPEGLKFVAPDLTEGEEGLEFSVQSFVVTPEELKLLKVKTNPNDTSSTKGELTIDTNMLRQLSEAGMSIGRQVPTELPAVNVVLNETRNAEALKAFVRDFGLKDDVANQLMEVITSIIEMSGHLKTEIHDMHSDGSKSEGSTVEMKKARPHRKRLEDKEQNEFNGSDEETAQHAHVKNSIAAAVLAALVTAEQFEEVNNNNGKEKYQLMLKSIDTILGKSINEDLVAAMYKILKQEDEKEVLCEEILECSSQPKLELIKIAVNSSLHKHSLAEEDIIEKFGDFLTMENEILGPAFKILAKNDKNLLQQVLGDVSNSISFMKTDHEATDTLQKAIVAAVQESSAKDLEKFLQENNAKEISNLIVQSVGLARVLGMRDVASKLLAMVDDEECLSKIANDPTSLNILKRLTVMKKLAEQQPALNAALKKLETEPELARTDPNLRELVRESAALMIVPEDPPLMSSADVPMSLLDPENSLAIEDFLFRRKQRHGALLIIKKGYQAVVPREASRAVLTGQVAYTVLDESGISHFEPLHVFSALNLDQPNKHRFSMYSCPVIETPDDGLENINGYCNITNSQITRIGGFGRRYSNGVLLEREHTRHRINNYDYTPSYRSYPSRSSTRSRSSCSRSPPKVEDVVVASSDYTAVADDEVSLRAGDIVEVLDSKAALGAKRPRLDPGVGPAVDPTLDVEAELLDISAAKHKRAVRPKKNYPRNKGGKENKEVNERWLVRVLEDVDGGEIKSRQGFVPACVLAKEKAGERDTTALAARRQAVVRELIETEEEFGRDMLQVVHRYMKPMDKNTTPKPVFDNRELLFSNFKQIAEFHNTALLEGIKYYAGEPKMLGRALLRMEREFDKHVAYCRDEPRAQHLLAFEPTVHAYFQALADKLGDDKGLSEHLKLPIQRINDYQLLLKELVKYSKRLGEDFSDLQKALDLFLSVPNRATDNKFIASIEGYRGNIYKLGRLLTHDWFTVTDSEGKARERYLFLFKARILVCKVKRVADDRSVFVLKDIIKLPEAEVKDIPEDPFKFELHHKATSYGVTLRAHKEPVKAAWLAEIKQNLSDVVALAEHAADDLQVLSPPQVVSPEPEEKKKRAREESAEATAEKRTKVEETKVKEETQVTTKRKAAVESEVATKVSKSEVKESLQASTAEKTSAKVEKTSEQKTSSSESTVQKETLEQKTSSSAEQKESFSSDQKSSHKTTVEEAKSASKTEESTVRASERKSLTFEQTSSIVQQKSSTVEQTSEESVQKTSSKKEAFVTRDQLLQRAVEADEVLTREESLAALQQKRKESLEGKSVHSTVRTNEVSEEKSQRVEESSVKSVEELKTSQREERTSLQTGQVSEHREETKTTEDVRRSSREGVSSAGEVEDKVIANGQAVTAQETGDEMSRYSRTSRLSGEYSSSRYESSSGYETTGRSSFSRTGGSRLESSRYETGGSVEGSGLSRIESSSRRESGSRLDGGSRYESSKYETGGSLDGSGLSRIESSSRRESSRYETGGSTEGTGRIESSSRRESSRYEAGGATEGNGLSRIESSSRRESSRYEADGSIEGSALSRIESKYSSRLEKGSKNGTEVNYESETSSKLDSIASKYGLGGDSTETTSKLDAIANKYGKQSESSYESSKIGRRSSSKYEVDYDNNIIEGGVTTKSESNYESKNGVSSIESTFSTKTAINGSVEEKIDRSIYKSASGDGRPVFTKTLSGQSIEPGENAAFECHLQEAADTKVTWLKDNKPLTDRFMDRVNIVTKEDGKNKLEIMHCREDDSGLYTARAVNKKGNAHCTAQLVVQELTPEERRAKNALNAPYFLVALKDTEILLNTYLRFMVKVKGDPNPEVKFYREGKEIRESSATERVSIVRTLSEKGCYELVIADVTHADAGKYSCKAMNIYGEEECEATVTVVDDKNIFFELPPGGEGLLAKGEKPSFTWKRDGEPFDPEERFKVLFGDDEDSLALVFQHVKPEDAGLYTCVAKTSTGSISCSAELTVQGAVHELHREPEKPKLIIEHREAIVAAGASAMLELQCKGYPKPNIIFKHDGKVIEADTRHKFLYESEESMSLVIKNVTNSDAGEYHVIAKNDLGEDSTTVQLVVKQAPKIKKKIENQSCMAGATHTVYIEVEGAPEPEVSFYKDGVEIKSSERIKIEKESSEVYKIIIKDAQISDSGSYSVVARNEMNQSSDFWQWNVTSPPKITKKMGSDKVVEEKETITFKIETEAEPAPTVKWFKNKKELVESSKVEISSSGKYHSLVITSAATSDAGEYSCEVRNVHGTAEDSCKLNVRSGPIFTQKLKDQVAAEGDVNVEFTVSVEAYPEPNIKWYHGDVEVTEKKSVFTRVDSGNTHKLILKEVSAEYSGKYSCKVSNEFGEDSCEATFTVKSKPRFTKSLVDMTVDEGHTLKLEVEVEGCPEPKLKWFKDGKEVTLDARIRIERDTQRLENYNLTVHLVKEEDGGEYEVRASNEMGSVSSKSTVTVHTKEVLSTLRRESLEEKKLEEESSKAKKLLEEDVSDSAKKKKAEKGKTEAETAEEKSFWDDYEDGKARKASVEDINAPKSLKAKKSVTEAEVAEEKSFWDDNKDVKARKASVDDVDAPKPSKGRKSITEPETAEEKSFWDDIKDGKERKASVDDVDAPKPLKGRKSITEPETAEEKSFWDDIKDSKERKASVDDIETPKPSKGRKSITEPETAEEKSFWDDNKDGKARKASVDNIETLKPSKGRKSITEPETAEEKSFWDDNKDGKARKASVDDIESPTPAKGRKSITESEKAEEKSFWDDNEDGKSRKPSVGGTDTPKPSKARKSITEPETAEEKSFWDDVDEDGKHKKPKIKDVDSPAANKGRKSITEPETAEEKKLWDDVEDKTNKKPIIEEIDDEKQTAQKGVTKSESIEEVTIQAPKRKSVKKETLEEPLSAETEGRVFETVTTFKTAKDGSIIMSKVSSSMSHGAIITGPAETRTLHKMTSKVIYEEDDDNGGGRKIIKPNQPHTTSLEVEEIASHSYIMTDLGLSIPDHVRRGVYGIIEEPGTDSEAENSSRGGRQYSNRTISIMSVSEDENSWHNDSLSRDVSIEDLSKSIFDIDDKRKVFSKDAYVRQSSFKEDYFSESGEEESIILTEKSEKVFENDITERIIHISRDFEDTKSKIDEVKNRLLEEFVLGPMKNIGNVTKDVTESFVERKKGSKLCSVQEEVNDDDLEALLRRSQRQRSILDEILTEETEKAPPTIKGSNMKDGSVYESLPLVYTIQAIGAPKPVVKWIHNGKEVKPSKRVHITNDGDIYKLTIDNVEMEDKGKWQCEISNDVGKHVQNAELSVNSVSEFRKPIFTTPLQAVSVMQREPVTLKAVCTADPLPHVSWLLNGELLIPDATVKTTTDSKDIEHGLKECTFTLHIPSGRFSDTGIYTIQAKNQYGFGESSARLDILLRPEIEGLKDVNVAPYEETTFIACVKANPIAEVVWSKDGMIIQQSDNFHIEEDIPSGKYSLKINKTGVKDAGVYKLTAKNKFGEAAQQARLGVHTNEPIFTKHLQKQSVKDYDDVTLAVRCDGVPKPEVHWYRDGEEITDDDRHQITTEVGGQVDSKLDIQHFNASDAGKYKVRAVSICGEAATEAQISLAQTSPTFTHRLDRQRDVDEGEPLELKCKVDASPMPTAKWFKDGVEIPKDDPHIVQTVLPDGTIKLNIDQVTPGDCGAYKLVVSNPNGENSALCAVAVNPTPRKPSFSQELEDTTAVAGQPLKLEAKVMAFPAPEIKWFKDGLPIRPSQAINFINQPGGIIGLSIDNVKPEDAGVYSLTVSNKLGDIGSKAKVDVTQKERKPAFIAELMPTKVIEGFPVKLEVKVLGHPQPKIKWTHNGKEIVPDGHHVKIVALPDGTHALLIDKATAADAGQYGVIAVNDKGETASTAELTVASRADDSSPQERPRFIHGLRDITAEEGKPLSVSAPFVGNPIPDVEWFKDGQPLNPSEKLLLTCDGKRGTFFITIGTVKNGLNNLVNEVGLEINPVELPDAGVYSVKLTNPLGEDDTQGKINVRKVYSPPKFTQTFSDLQQLPTFDAKFPARVHGLPTPEITWYKNGQLIRESEKYHIKRDGDACCLYVRDLTLDDAGTYKCVAKNKEGEASCEAALEVVDKIGAKKQKMEPPTFLKKIGDTEVLRGMSAKFTACATGTPDPDVEWFRNGERLFPCDRIRMDKETTGLLRLTIAQVDPTDVGTYKCRIYNPHGEDSCTAELTYDSLEPQQQKRPISDQYSDFDKMKKTGIPMPLADKPIISRMADRHLTLSWKPSIPHGPRFPVTYQVEMCEVPDGDWFTARTGLRSCVCDIRNLEPFKDYKFRIRVENKYGVSDPSPYAITQRSKLEPDPPKFVPYLAPGIDFRPETSPYFPKDFDIERPPHDGYAQAPKFLRQEHDSQYGVKGHNVNLFWFVYGYPKPKMTYFFNDEPIEIGGRYDWSYTRNGQATLFINKMMDRDAGWYEAVATNEHGQARQRVRLEVAEYPYFIKRPEETVVLQRKTVRIEARVFGVPYPEIKWYKDWQPLAPSSRTKIQFIEPDTTVLIINDCILKDEGLYSVSARNVAGAVSSSAMLHVEESEYEYSDRIREHPPRVKPSTKPFGDFYDLGDELGRGVQGVVYHAAERLTGRNYAAKIMHGHSDLKPFMKNELDIMNMLNDRHLVRLHDAYEHDHTLALVMELASGGELVRDRLLRSQGYTEREIAGYIRQVLRGLKYMHDNSIAHLGLTIGELLLSHAGSDELKLCDFGLSRRIHFNQHASLDYGMPEFVAPEIASGEGVSYGADMWSLGIITYILLSGHSPFRGYNDRETLTKIREGRWEWHDEEWWNRLSTESRDFISRLLKFNWHERMDVNAALNHPWLNLADKIYQDEYVITTDRLRNYYNLYRDWISNAQCRNWFRRRPLSGAFEHPSKMVYPPGDTYTPEATPDRDRTSRDRQPGLWDLKFKQWEHPDWEVSAKSESHYQNGPDTYLLQLRDTNFPVRLREYMKVASNRSPAFYLSNKDCYDPRTPIIHERRRFTDIMDEEISDEQKERINQYGTDMSYTIRRLRHELGTRLDSYAEAQAIMESKKDGYLPFLREKPLHLAIREGEPAQMSCFAVGDPKPSVQWFKNDMVIAEGQRIKIIEDEEGRSTLRFEPAMPHDVGFYKVVARNKVGQTVARTRIVEATNPDAPDSPTAQEVSDTEVLLRWKQPKYDGNSPVVCYSLQYKEGDSIEWKEVASNIDHEFFVVRNLKPDTSYQFRLSSRNRIGWSDKGIPTQLIKTKASGAQQIEVTKAMRHLQQLTESGQEIVLDEEKPKLDYTIEENPVNWDTSSSFTDRYSFISELWRGKFSIVVKGVDKNTDSVVVAKILEVRPETEVQIQREFECLRRLRHERISNLLGAYQAPGSPVAALILEKLQGADVLTYLASRHEYSEQTVSTIVTQVLDALQYLHWRGYCHLDLQPDNVVMASVRSIQVKLIDFGSAHKVTKLGTSVPQVGDLEYKAPEIVNDEPAYPQTDIWSLGVLTYIMLSGVSPFRGSDDAETKANISFVRYRFEHLYKEITQEATRFLMFLFKKVPLKRPTAEECHEHRWLTHSDFMNKKRERAVFLGNRLKEFSDEYHEKKAQEASKADTITSAFGQLSPRLLTRSNSIQDELQTTFATH